VYCESVNALYRVVIPMMGLQQLGHEVVDAKQVPGQPVSIEQLVDCDVVHIHRLRLEDQLEDPIDRLREAGVVVSIDEDDDMSAGTPEIERLVGADNFAVGQRQFAELLKRLPDADLVTTPSDVLADRFEAAGAHVIEVIDNYLLDQFGGTFPRGMTAS